jgi:hypothetical protein
VTPTKDDILTAIKAGVVTQAEVLTALGECQPETLQWAAQIARGENATDDLEIDHLPLFSDADDGVWVSAWIFVYKDRP